MCARAAYSGYFVEECLIRCRACHGKPSRIATWQKPYGNANARSKRAAQRSSQSRNFSGSVGFDWKSDACVWRESARPGCPRSEDTRRRKLRRIKGKLLFFCAIAKCVKDERHRERGVEGSNGPMGCETSVRPRGGLT